MRPTVSGKTCFQNESSMSQCIEVHNCLQFHKQCSVLCSFRLPDFETMINLGLCIDDLGKHGLSRTIVSTKMMHGAVYENMYDKVDNIAHSFHFYFNGSYTGSPN